MYLSSTAFQTDICTILSIHLSSTAFQTDICTILSICLPRQKTSVADNFIVS